MAAPEISAHWYMTRKQEEKMDNRPEQETETLVRKTIMDLFEYCARNDWAGYDPFDGLNSRLFNALPLAKSSLARLAFTQAMKRLPVNLRPLLLIPKSHNPKGLSVFSSALVNLSESGVIKGDGLVRDLLKRLKELRSKGRNCCWGYNFDWQNRVLRLPRFSPNIICTTFAGNAFLDAYGSSDEKEYLDVARSAGHFILEEIPVTAEGDSLCFSYTTMRRDQVHNANLLGAAYLARLYAVSHDTRFLEPACRAVRYSVRRQLADGSWAYGESGIQRWIDNFHTGYNLLALKRFSEYAGNNEYEHNLRKGFQFYRDNFFTRSGAPRYYHDRTYPIDIHSVSQSIITLIEFRDMDETGLELALQVFRWAIREMLSSSGYFYYQTQRFFKNRIPYARWSQAWMLYSLSVLLRGLQAGGGPSVSAGTP